LNFVCSTRDAKSQNFFVTVLEAKKDGDCYEALINSRRGFEERTLPAEEVDNAKGRYAHYEHFDVSLSIYQFV